MSDLEVVPCPRCKFPMAWNRGERPITICNACVERLATDALRAELAALRRVVEVARKIRASRDEQHARVAKMQALAVEARKDHASAKAKLAQIDSQPRVWDLGDLVEDLCAALLALPGER